MLRHWFISWALDRPDNALTETQFIKIVGHADFEMIRNTYYHLDVEGESGRKMRETPLFSGMKVDGVAIVGSVRRQRTPRGLMPSPSVGRVVGQDWEVPVATDGTDADTTRRLRRRGSEVLECFGRFCYLAMFATRLPQRGENQINPQQCQGLVIIGGETGIQISLQHYDLQCI